MVTIDVNDDWVATGRPIWEKVSWKTKKKLPAPACQVNIKRNELLLWLLLRSPLRDVATPNMNGTLQSPIFKLRSLYYALV